MKANKVLSALKGECEKHRICDERCVLYNPDCNAVCAIRRLTGENPRNIDFEELKELASGESIELPAKFDNIPNLKIKAENVYINMNGGD
jgi:hypothetical protein